MKHCILLISALTLVTLTINAQEMAFAAKPDLTESPALTNAPPSNVNAQFPGCDEALAKYFEEHLDYTIESRSNALEGVVIVEFLVRKNGRLSKFKIIETPHENLSASALAALKGMSKWIPAKRQNVDVASRVLLPIHFGLR